MDQLVTCGCGHHIAFHSVNGCIYGGCECVSDVDAVFEEALDIVRKRWEVQGSVRGVSFDTA